MSTARIAPTTAIGRLSDATSQAGATASSPPVSAWSTTVYRHQPIAPSAPPSSASSVPSAT